MSANHIIIITLKNNDRVYKINKHIPENINFGPVKNKYTLASDINRKKRTMKITRNCKK